MIDSLTSATGLTAASILLEPSVSQRLAPTIGAIGLAIERAHMNPDECERLRRSISRWMMRWHQRNCCLNCALSQITGVCSLREGVRCEDAKASGIAHEPPDLDAASSQRGGRIIDVRALLALADCEVTGAVLGWHSAAFDALNDIPAEEPAPELSLGNRDGWVVSTHRHCLTLHRKIRGEGEIAAFREENSVAVKMLRAGTEKETICVTGIPGTCDVIASVVRALERSPSGWPDHVRWSELVDATATLIGPAATSETSHTS